jgi:predicted nucleotidyltransferase
MVRAAEIQEFVDKIVEEFAPQRVILFGSHARGDATPDSDVDLLVVMPTKKEAIEQAVEVRQRIRRSFPLDLIVKTPEDVAWRLSLQDCFLTTIMTEGKTLYESVGG